MQLQAPCPTKSNRGCWSRRFSWDALRSPASWTTRLLALAIALTVATGAGATAEPAVSLSAESTLGEARERLARGDANGALQAIDRALQIEAGNAQLQFLRGVVLMDLGRDVLALDVFEQLHQRYPELADPLNNIGLLQARAGQLESARQTLLEALRADPQHRAARSNLGQVYLMLAVQAWEAATAGVNPDADLSRRLDAARALLVKPAR